MKKIFVTMILGAFIALPSFSQHQGRGGQNNANEMMQKMKEEAAKYYAGTDTAAYAVRYRFKYKYNKENNLTFEEDRMLLIRPEVTLDMSYEGMGENRWRQKNPNARGGGDPTLAYHLTPSYYFYYPDTDNLIKTYRIISEEFKLSDGKAGNKWDITGETKKIGDYNCRKATLSKDGREWTAWFTNDLEGKGGPRTLTGLPGVVIEASDADGEVCWAFNGIIKNEPESKLYVKFPDKFSDVSVENFGKLVKIFALAGGGEVQRSGVMEINPGMYPEKYRPSTGIDALNIDNPIER